MERAGRAITEMQLGLRNWKEASAGASCGEAVEQIDLLCDSVQARLLLLSFYSSLLSRENLLEMGRLEGFFPDKDLEAVLVATEGMRLSVSTPKWCVAVKLLAFSGAVSACVNAADTLARLLAVAYDIRIGRHPQLEAILERLAEDSLLAPILRDSPGLDWMGPVRSLHAECQHGAILSTYQSRAGGSAVPYVKGVWCNESDEGMPMPQYVNWAEESVEELIEGVASAVAFDPERALLIRSQS